MLNIRARLRRTLLGLRNWFEVILLLFAASLIVAGVIVTGTTLTSDPEEFDRGVAAPLMAMVGGALFLVGFYPSLRPWINGSIRFLGALSGMGAAWFWLEDATEGEAGTLVLVIFMGSAAMALMMSVIIFLSETVRSAFVPRGPDGDQPHKAPQD